MSRHDLSLKIQPQLWEPGPAPESERQIHHIFPTRRLKKWTQEGGGKAILTTGSEVKRQVLLPAAEKEGDFKQRVGGVRAG